MSAMGTKSFVGSSGVVVLLLLGLWGCEGDTPSGSSQAVSESAVPAEFSPGEKLFNANCAACHGGQAKGSNQGPPLVHKVYEPSHHGDQSFHLAARNGVRAHHWQFGDMSAIQGVSQAQVDQIVQYVRWLQRQAGIS